MSGLCWPFRVLLRPYLSSRPLLCANRTEFANPRDLTTHYIMWSNYNGYNILLYSFYCLYNCIVVVAAAAAAAAAAFVVVVVVVVVKSNTALSTS